MSLTSRTFYVVMLLSSHPILTPRSPSKNRFEMSTNKFKILYESKIFLSKLKLHDVQLIWLWIIKKVNFHIIVFRLFLEATLQIFLIFETMYNVT